MGDKKSKKKGQSEFGGMPKPTGAAKIGQEWLRKRAEGRVIDSEQDKIAARVLAAMKQEKHEVMIVVDPDSNEKQKFIIDPGSVKLRVTKVPEKVGKNV